ncbi:CCHC-type domain-containing protein [Trichonephila inaurata madagascariensis]|uniref:CCHC-type domain-containing protein n=1 Tax=Trichonephila inaurata madagascariensis TaxID=2747483 RepID=A0A8X7CET9_9ARAC|nr:CCHC-type domain-containing protein [Trichonephila inaurata madagascariensis]
MSLIRQVVREEMQHVFSQPLNIKQPELQSIEAIIKDEVNRSLATIISQPITASQQFFSSEQQPTLKTPRRPTTYAARSPMVAPPPQYEAQRKTDWWRTADSRPVCFHCGRPGHVVRYCHERRAIFNDYRRNNPRNYNLPERRTHPTKITQSSSRKITNTPYEVSITNAIPNFQPIAKPRGKLSLSPSIEGEVVNFRNPPLVAKLHGNHIDVFIDNQPVKALVDSGA